MKKLGKLAFILLFAAMCLIALSACAGSGTVTNIVLETGEVRIASYGENSTFQIYPTVYPETASNKKVTFRLKTMEDAEFVGVSSKGLISGIKAKEDGKPVEIIVKSVDNPRVTATVFVYVEDVPVERVYFSPRAKTVYIDQAPFAVKAKYYPAHASEGTDLSYVSDNPEVATVTADGIVTVASRGMTNIVATNTSGVKDFLELKVLMTPPSYLLSETPASSNSYNQVPGDPQKIAYTLIPGLNNDQNCSISWYAEAKEIVSNRNKLTFEYTPSADLLPGVYNVTVEIRDSDDQTQKIISKNINVYYDFNGLEGISADTEKEYFVSDRIEITPLVNEQEQRPEGYLWYYRPLTGEEDEAVLSNYANYRQIGKTDYTEKERGKYAFYPETAGEIVVAAVPIVGGKPRYSALVHTDAFTVNLLENGSPYYNVTFGATEENGETLLTLRWGFMPGESEFVLEIDDGNAVAFFSSAEHPEYFTDTSAVLPANVLPIGKSATVRLRTSRYGFGEEYEYSAGSAEANAELLKLNRPVAGLPFRYYVTSMSEMGEILNYIRFFRPGQSGYAAETEGIEYVYDAEDKNGYEHGFRFTVGFGFDFADVALSYDKSLSPYNQIASKFYIADRDMPASATETEQKRFGYFKKDYNEAVDKIFSAFLAYGESGSVSISIAPKYFGTDGGKMTLQNNKGTVTLPTSDTQSYAVRVVVYLEDEPYGETLKSSREKEKMKDASKYVQTVSMSPRGEGYDAYFTDNLGEISVSNGQQLYLAASWGMKPVPIAGSAAEKILAEAKSVMNRILGDDIYGDENKVRAIHDYIVCNISYDYDLASKKGAHTLSYGFCLEGVFLEHYAVCDGLSKAVSLMCYMEGIAAFKISGVTMEGEGHAWNKVFIGGKWKLLDTTWDSTALLNGNPNVNIPIRDYLLKTDKDNGFREGIDRRTYGEYPAAR